MIAFRRAYLYVAAAVSLQVVEGEAVLSVDGQPAIPIPPGESVSVRAGEFPALFVRFGDAGYFYRNLTAHMNQNPSIGMPR